MSASTGLGLKDQGMPTSKQLSLFTKSMIYETGLAIFLGLLTCFADYLLLPLIEKNQGNPWLVFVPLCFLAFNAFVKGIEWYLFGDNASMRTIRIIQGLLLLCVVALSRLPTVLVPVEYLKSLEANTSSDAITFAARVVNIWLMIATTFPGACGTVLIYRVCLDFGVKAHLLEGLSLPLSDSLPTEGNEKENTAPQKVRRSAVSRNRKRIVDPNANY